MRGRPTKRSLPVLLSLGLAVSGSGLADVERDIYEDDPDEADFELEETGPHPEDGLGDMSAIDDEWGFAESEFSAFEADDVLEDEHGFFDGDFEWEADDDGWDDWYDASADAWRENDDSDGVWDL